MEDGRENENNLIITCKSPKNLVTLHAKACDL